MSPKKFYYFFMLLGLLASFRVYSQKPNACINPSAYSAKLGTNSVVDGDFGLDSSFCLNNGTATVTVTPTTATNPYYIFNVRDSALPSTFSISTIQGVTTADVGEYWVMQIFVKTVGSTSTNHISCKRTHIFDTKVPVISQTTCGQKVNLLIDASNKYNSYTINWGDATGETKAVTAGTATTISHTYSGSASRDIVVVGNYDNPDVLSTALTVCNSKPYATKFTPTTSLYTSRLEMTDKGMGAKISFANGGTTTYTLEAEKNGSGNWLIVGTGTNGTAVVPPSPGLDSTANYCFRLKGTDACGNAIVTAPICSIIEKISVISTTEVQVNWNKPTTPYSVSYEVVRSEAGNSGITLAPTPATNTQYDDKGVNCKKYTYQVTGVYTDADGNTIRTISAPKDVSPAGTASLPVLDPLGIASVEDNNSKIKFVVVDANSASRNAYRFERMVDNNNNWVVVATNNKSGSTSPSNVYIDTDIDVLNHRYCYQLSYSDECNNWSPPTISFCSILLHTDDSGSLNWTPFIDNPVYKAFVTYSVWEADPITGLPSNIIMSLRNLTNTNAIVPLSGTSDTQTFVVVAQYAPPGIPTGTNLPSKSNTVTINIPGKLYVPNAFTPNADLDNPTFEVKSKFISNYSIVIFDRWGSPIFESKDITNSWDGTINGTTNQAPAGTYSYVISATDTHGKEISRTGSVTLLR